MPRANIFIRAEDYDKWVAIERKSEFIHNALNESIAALDSMGKPIKNPEEVPAFLGFKTCKHGADPEFCRFAKNGKPCKM